MACVNDEEDGVHAQDDIDEECDSVCAEDVFYTSLIECGPS